MQLLQYLTTYNMVFPCVAGCFKVYSLTASIVLLNLRTNYPCKNILMFSTCILSALNNCIKKQNLTTTMESSLACRYLPYVINHSWPFPVAIKWSLRSVLNKQTNKQTRMKSQSSDLVTVIISVLVKFQWQNIPIVHVRYIIIIIIHIFTC